MFEWTPSIDHDGRILYSRWDYVDRYNMPFMKLWSTKPDGTNAAGRLRQLHPQSALSRSRPGRFPTRTRSIFTGSGASRDDRRAAGAVGPAGGADGTAAMTRLTPEVCFPETEGWPQSYFAGP